jgi:cytochrome b561
MAMSAISIAVTATTAAEFMTEAGGDMPPAAIWSAGLVPKFLEEGSMQKVRTRFDMVSVVLHWSIGTAIIAVAAIELLRGEVFPKGSHFRDALRALHDPAGTVVFALVLLRLGWRSLHPAPAMPESVRAWEKVAAKLTHYALYLMMVMIPLTGMAYVLARGRSIDFGLFQIVYPLDHVVSRNASRTLKSAHEFLGQAILVLALVHAAAALWHHYVRKDKVLSRMWPTRRSQPVGTD